MNLGNKISELRKEKKLTQEELAKMVNVSAKTISSWENNRNLPSIDMLISLSNELDTSIDILLDLNKENKKEKSKLYEQRSFKENLINILITALIFILPILFFWYAGYITIAAYTAHLWAFENPDLVETSRIMLNLFSTFVIEYFIYLIFIFINYILYKKKHPYILIVINTFILTTIACNRFDILPIIMLVLFIIEVILSLRKNKRILFYFNIILAVISLITYIILLVTNSFFDLDYSIYIIACIIGIYWSITRIK